MKSEMLAAMCSNKRIACWLFPASGFITSE